jgi:hypothetical protein
VATRTREPHELACSLFENIKARQSVLLSNTRTLIGVYQWGYRTGQYHNPSAHVPFDDDVMGFNCAQNTVDTLHAKLCKTRIIPMPLTDGGNSIERRRARQMGDAIDGEWEENDVESIKEDVILDALVTGHGAGAAIVYDREDKVCIEHVPIDDIFFDDAEVRYRKPRTLIRRMRMDRYVARAVFGGKGKGLYGNASDRRALILDAPPAPNEDGEPVEADQIEVVEMWHLPSDDYDGDDDDAPESGEYDRVRDGRHFIGTANCTFVDEPWEDNEFPIYLYVPRKRRRHILGLSIMWNLAAPQKEYEKLSGRIQRSHHLMGGTHLYVQRGSNIDIHDLDNAQGTVVEGDGPKPEELNPTPCNPQTYEYQESIARNMNMKTGISEMSASSQVPAGLSQASGKALQVFEDAEDGRLLLYHREIERWVCAVAWGIVKAARRIVERNPEYAARYRDRKGLRKVKWKSVLADKGSFVLKVFPVSNLSKQPSARFEQLTELLNAGAINIEQFKRLFGFADLDAERELDVADTEVIDTNLDLIFFEGRSIQPEPFDDLALLKQRTGKYYNMRRAESGVPQDALKRVRQYWLDADAREKSQLAAQAPANTMGAPPMGEAPPPGMAPPDLPGAPPAMAAGPPPPIAA